MSNALLAVSQSVIKKKDQAPAARSASEGSCGICFLGAGALLVQPLSRRVDCGLHDAVHDNDDQRREQWSHDWETVAAETDKIQRGQRTGPSGALEEGDQECIAIPMGPEEGQEDHGFKV
jgi:hypothetical protein